jgi:hypothetical protein
VSEDLESRVLFLSSKGQLSVADADLNILNTQDTIEDGASLIESFFFPRKSCSFLPARTTPPRGVIAVLLLKVDNSIRIQILAICDDEVIALGNCGIKVEPDVRNPVSIERLAETPGSKSPARLAVLRVI